MFFLKREVESVLNRSARKESFSEQSREPIGVAHIGGRIPNCDPGLGTLMLGEYPQKFTTNNLGRNKRKIKQNRRTKYLWPKSPQSDDASLV